MINRVFNISPYRNRSVSKLTFRSFPFAIAKRKKEGLWLVGVVRDKAALLEATCTWQLEENEFTKCLENVPFYVYRARNACNFVALLARFLPIFLLPWCSEGLQIVTFSMERLGR